MPVDTMVEVGGEIRGPVLGDAVEILQGVEQRRQPKPMFSRSCLLGGTLLWAAMASSAAAMPDDSWPVVSLASASSGDDV
jgi:hypothetical protein